VFQAEEEEEEERNKRYLDKCEYLTFCHNMYTADGYLK
jgi:hypothetical protein